MRFSDDYLRMKAVKLAKFSLVLFAVTLIIVAFPAQGLYLSSSASNSTLNSGAVSCQTNFPAGLQMQSGSGGGGVAGLQDRTLLVMAPGSSAQICVTYSVIAGASVLQATILPQIKFLISLYSFKVSVATSGVGYGFSYSALNGIANASSPANVKTQALISATNVNVVYTLTAPKGSAGLYSLSFTNSCPTPLPFAISSNASQITAGDFPGFFLPGDCPVQPPLSTGTITGFSGIQTVTLSSEIN